MHTMVLYQIRNNEENFTLGYAKDFATAKQIAKGRGFWGADASIHSEIIKIFDSVEDYVSSKQANSIKNKNG